MPNSVKVFAPASIANVCCGFDVLGFAIYGSGDEIRATLTEQPGVTIKSITGDNGQLPTDSTNSACISAQAFLDSINADKGIEIELHKKMPLSSGLGSSAASAAAAVFAANKLFDEPLKKEELLPFVLVAETVVSGGEHADNAAPSLLGGFVLIRGYNPLDVVKIPLPELFCTIIHPDFMINTKDARNILKKEVSLKKTVTQTGNIAGLIAGLHMENYGLISRSLQDVIIEPQRAALIPGFAEVRQAAINSGVLGCGIAGGGPSLFAFSKDEETAKKAGEAMQKVFAANNILSNVYVSKINEEGSKVIEND